jgi:DNA-binding LacI/PurR family transcriptional regulator
MANIKDVAALAGVSIAPVSNVLRGTKSVSPDLHSKVMEAVGSLNYTVNPIASSLKAKRSSTVGVVFAAFSRLVASRYLDGIEDAATRFGYKVEAHYTTGDLRKEMEAVGRLQNSRVSGIILASCADMKKPRDAEYIKALDDDTPIVGLEHPLFGGSSVTANHAQAAGELTEYMIWQGYKKIAHIAGPVNIPIYAARYQGWRDSLGSAGIAPSNGWLAAGDLTPASGYSLAKGILEYTDVNAIFAGSDLMAIGALKAVKEAGRNVPKDFAVAGFDGHFAASLVTPSLTTMHVPRYDMGEQAMELLHAMIKFPDAEPQVFQSTATIMPRQSTGADDNIWDIDNW